MTAPGWRLGFDIGGTFTDFALHDLATGRLVVGKTLTTPHDPAEGVFHVSKPCRPRPGCDSGTSRRPCTAPRSAPTS